MEKKHSQNTQGLLISKCKIVRLNSGGKSDSQPAPGAGRVKWSGLCVSPRHLTDVQLEDVTVPPSPGGTKGAVSRAQTPLRPDPVHLLLQVRKQTQILDSYHHALWIMVSGV